MSNPSLHVVHLVLKLDIGGLERMVVDLAREGLRLGQRVTVACVEERGQLAPQVEALGIPVICADKPVGVRPRTVWTLGRLFRAAKPDVIHSHQIGALFYGGLAARGLRIPVVHTEHGKHYSPGSSSSTWLGRAAGWQAARFLCVSQDIADGIRTRRVAPASRIGVVPNGIDLTKFADGHGEDGKGVRAALGIPASALLVGTVGRLNGIKRQDLLLQGFARLKAQVSNAHLLLVGDGPEAAALRTLGDRLGLGDSVHFAGYQPQPERFMRAMDVFALTSRSEGMPVSVLEAWGARVPVVASRVGGLAEMIESGRNGLLFDFGDEAGLVAALQRCLVDPPFSDRIRAAARADVETRYNLAETARIYQREYDGTIGR